MAESAGAVGHRDRPGRWPARSSSPRRGTPAACTRSAASSATAGSSGTAASATTSAPSSRAIAGMVGAVGQRFLGSPDIYGHKHREPEASINFVTCHDGFTLNDLVSYDAKHNEANGEGNRDGNDQNLSWNCGVEGPTDDPAIEALRAPPGQEPPRLRPAVARARRCCSWATRSAGRRAATTTPTATTTRRAGSTGRPSSATPTSCASPSGLIRDPPPVSSTLLDVPDDAGLLDMLARRLARVERGRGRRARPRRRLAQRRADGPGRRGRPAPDLQRLLGAARVRAARARRDRRGLAADRRHEPRRTGRHRRGHRRRDRVDRRDLSHAEPRSVVAAGGATGGPHAPQGGQS